MLGIPLDGQTFERYYEVCRVDVDGLNPVSVGYFKNELIANAFAGDKDAQYYKVYPAILLVSKDSKTGIVITSAKDSPKIFDDEEEALRLKKSAVEKLTPDEQKLLGLSQ